MKEKALTGGGLEIDSVSMGQEVSRGHSSWSKRAAKRYRRSLTEQWRTEH